MYFYIHASVPLFFLSVILFGEWNDFKTKLSWCVAKRTHVRENILNGTAPMAGFIMFLLLLCPLHQF